jgi:hypothetical protein
MRSSRPAILSLALLGALSFSPQANAEPMAAPSGPQPMPTRAIVQDGTLYRQQALFVPETRTRLVTVDGKMREEAYTVMVPQIQVASTPKEGYRVFTIEGKLLTDAEVATALAKETEVLHSIHGKLMDPRYRPLYAPETLIIYLKPEFAFPGYGSPQAPGEPAPKAPTFSSAPAPKGLPPTVGFLRSGDAGEVILTEYRWDMVSEFKPVHFEVKDSNGNPSTVTKVVSQVHWIPEPIETRLKPTDLTSMDRSGKQTHGLFDELPEPLAVFLHNVGSEFDPGHFKLCQPYVAVVQGKFPVERLMTSYGAPPAPVEAFASVKDDHLIVGKMISESITVERQVTVVRDGKEESRTITEAKTVHKYVPQRLELAAVRAQEASGKALDAAELKRRLATETPVMTAIGDDPVDPIYLVPLKPDTIVLTLPSIRSPAPAAAPPPSPPGAPQAAAPAESPASPQFVAAQAPAAIDPAAQAPLKAPADGPPPRLVKIQAFGDKLVLREPKTMFAFAPVAEPKPGEPRAQPKPKAMTHVDSRVLDASAFRLYEVDGRPMDPATLVECAARPIIALLSDHGKKIDPAWLSIYNPGALLVYVRPQAMVVHATPVPIAPPPPADSPPPPPVDSAPPAPTEGA